MQYSLPKLWLARIPDIWDKTIPTGYPVSSSEFSLSFGDEDTRQAVLEMEANLKTEESIITSVIPENHVCNGYVGTYDVIAEAGVETLLSPEKVNTENVIAMHYNSNTDGWEQIEDISVKDGYVWGTLQDFSPIAIFTYIKDIHEEASVPGVSANVIVCEGNVVKIYSDEDGKVYVESGTTGTKIEVTKKSIVIGGSADGRAIEKTSIAVVGIKDNTKVNKIIGGSVYIDEGFTTVGSVNVTGKDSVIGGLTGSFGAVRTQSVNYDLENATIGFMGCGEGYRQVGTPNPSFASRDWAKDVNIKLVNVTANLAFFGQNCEYFYVHNTNAYVEGGKFDYMILGGSNDGTNKTEAVVKDAQIGIFQTTNRGNVADAKATFTGCTIDHLYVGGDASDSTVTGTTTKFKYEINASDHGSYVFENGTEAGKLLDAETADRIIDSIKVSRNVDVTIAPELLNILGAKYIIK